MHYTTVTVELVEGHEKDGINDAIAQGLNELKEEINGPVELVNMAYVVIGEKLCVTVLARPYKPLALGGGGLPMQDVLMHVLRENRLV